MVGRQQNCQKGPLTHFLTESFVSELWLVCLFVLSFLCSLGISLLLGVKLAKLLSHSVVFFFTRLFFFETAKSY